MSIFLMGCYDPGSQKWCTVTKCSGGHDDATLARLQKELDMVKISKVRKGSGWPGPLDWPLSQTGCAWGTAGIIDLSPQKELLIGHGRNMRPPESLSANLVQTGHMPPRPYPLWAGRIPRGEGELLVKSHFTQACDWGGE